MKAAGGRADSGSSSSTFCVSFDPNNDEQMQEFQRFMEGLHAAQYREADAIAEQLDVSAACAFDVQYLRTRSRWTQELEDRLIQLHRDGNPPNIFDFGHKEL